MSRFIVNNVIKQESHPIYHQREMSLSFFSKYEFFDLYTRFSFFSEENIQSANRGFPQIDHSFRSARMYWRKKIQQKIFL